MCHRFRAWRSIECSQLSLRSGGGARLTYDTIFVVMPSYFGAEEDRGEGAVWITPSAEFLASFKQSREGKKDRS